MQWRSVVTRVADVCQNTMEVDQCVTKSQWGTRAAVTSDVRDAPEDAGYLARRPYISDYDADRVLAAAYPDFVGGYRFTPLYADGRDVAFEHTRRALAAEHWSLQTGLPIAHNPQFRRYGYPYSM